MLRLRIGLLPMPRAQGRLAITALVPPPFLCWCSVSVAWGTMGMLCFGAFKL